MLREVAAPADLHYDPLAMTRVAAEDGRKKAGLPDLDKLQTEDELLESAELVMDHYLENTSYYRQTMLSIGTAAASVWRKKVFANGPEHTKSSLQGFLINTGLVSALLIGVSYQSATSPVTSDDPEDASAVSVTAVFAGVSLVFSLSVIVVSVIYLIEVDNCTTDRDLRDFLNANARFVDLLTGVFSASVVCLLVSALACMYITYGWHEFLVVACVAGFISISGGVFAAIVAGHNRFRLWVRYDSPEAVKMLSVIKGDEARKLAALRMDLLFQQHELRDLKELLELKDIKDRIRDERLAQERAGKAPKGGQEPEGKVAPRSSPGLATYDS